MATTNSMWRTGCGSAAGCAVLLCTRNAACSLAAALPWISQECLALTLPCDSPAGGACVHHGSQGRGEPADIALPSCLNVPCWAFASLLPRSVCSAHTYMALQPRARLRWVRRPSACCACCAARSSASPAPGPSWRTCSAPWSGCPATTSTRPSRWGAPECPIGHALWPCISACIHADWPATGMTDPLGCMCPVPCLLVRGILQAVPSCMHAQAAPDLLNVRHWLARGGHLCMHRPAHRAGQRCKMLSLARCHAGRAAEQPEGEAGLEGGGQARGQGDGHPRRARRGPRGRAAARGRLLIPQQHARPSPQHGGACCMQPVCMHASLLEHCGAAHAC